MRTFQIQKEVACPFSAAIEYAEDYFRLGEHGHREQTLSLPLRVGPFTFRLRRRISTEILIGPDPTDAARRHDAMWIWLHPLHGSPFPVFRGVLTVRPFAPGTRVSFECTYTPPLAFLGRAIDATVGRFVGRGIAQAVLDEVAAHLETRYAEFRKTCSSESQESQGASHRNAV